MKYILLLLTLNAYGAMITFNQGDQINAADINNNFNEIKAEVELKGHTLTSSEVSIGQSVDLSVWSEFSTELVNLGVESSSLYEVTGTVIKSSIINEFFSVNLLAISSLAPKVKMIYRSNSLEYGTELFLSDGSLEGTNIIDIMPGILPGMCTLPENEGEYQCEDLDCDLPENAGNQYCLPYPASSNPVIEGRLGDLVLFKAHTFDYGEELWAFNITNPISSGNPYLIKDLCPDNNGFNSDDSSQPQCGYIGGLNFRLILDGKMIFKASSSSSDYDNEIWVTDGTSEGTIKVHDMGGTYFTKVNEEGKLIYVAGGQTTGTFTWIYELSLPPSGTNPYILKDMCSAQNVHGHYYYEESKDYVYISDNNILFQGRSGSTCSSGELWTSDGTTAGTTYVHDVYDGISTGFRVVNTGTPDVVPFRSSNGLTVIYDEDGLWTSDGTTAGTIHRNPTIWPLSMIELPNGEIYTVANSGTRYANSGLYKIESDYSYNLISSLRYINDLYITSDSSFIFTGMDTSNHSDLYRGSSTGVIRTNLTDGRIKKVTHWKDNLYLVFTIDIDLSRHSLLYNTDTFEIEEFNIPVHDDLSPYIF